MVPNTENNEILPSKLTEMSDFDALEKQLDTVLGTLQEKIPAIEAKVDVPSFQLGATPAYSQTTNQTTKENTSQSSVSQKEEQPVPASTSEFHTISGGPETLKESIEKKAPSIHREHAQIVAGMYTKKKADVYVEEKILLSPTLFFWFSAVTFIFFMLGAGLPFIMELLVKYNYLLLEGNVYRDGAISFPVALVDNILLLTFQLTVTSMFIPLITGAVDYGMKKSFGDLTRALVHGAIVLIFGYIIFQFCKNQGVTWEQIRQVFLIIKEAVMGVVGDLKQDKPLL
jgi:hypothetical protein